MSQKFLLTAAALVALASTQGVAANTPHHFVKVHEQRNKERDVKLVSTHKQHTKAHKLQRRQTKSSEVLESVQISSEQKFQIASALKTAANVLVKANIIGLLDECIYLGNQNQILEEGWSFGLGDGAFTFDGNNKPKTQVNEEGWSFGVGDGSFTFNGNNKPVQKTEVNEEGWSFGLGDGSFTFNGDNKPKTQQVNEEGWSFGVGDGSFTFNGNNKPKTTEILGENDPDTKPKWTFGRNSDGSFVFNGTNKQQQALLEEVEEQRMKIGSISKVISNAIKIVDVASQTGVLDEVFDELNTQQSFKLGSTLKKAAKVLVTANELGMFASHFYLINFYL
jgi:hypothetical protein